jgi:hypothetical protein
MTAFETTCRELAQSVEGALACGVVDLDAARVLALEVDGGSAERFSDAFLKSSLELFQVPSGELLERAGSAPLPARTFSEVQLGSATTYHFAKTLSAGNHAVVLVTNRDTNVGLGWAQVKLAVATLERLIAE